MKLFKNLVIIIWPVVILIISSTIFNQIMKIAGRGWDCSGPGGLACIALINTLLPLIIPFLLFVLLLPVIGLVIGIIIRKKIVFIETSIIYYLFLISNLALIYFSHSTIEELFTRPLLKITVLLIIPGITLSAALFLAEQKTKKIAN